MAEYEEDYSFECPYCGSENSVHIDHTAGRRQSFTQDCENCCNPISIKLVLDDDGVEEFSAEQES
jgi:transcription elongation factor Elf1